MRICALGIKPMIISAHISNWDIKVGIMHICCLPGTESFGLFSCTINGEERDQTHRAVFRWVILCLPVSWFSLNAPGVLKVHKTVQTIKDIRLAHTSLWFPLIYFEAYSCLESMMQIMQPPTPQVHPTPCRWAGARCRWSAFRRGRRGRLLVPWVQHAHGSERDFPGVLRPWGRRSDERSDE